MRCPIVLLSLTLPVMSLASVQGASPDRPSPVEATVKLKTGNARYALGKAKHPRQGPERRRETFEGGQRPFATILTCSDSRVPVEILFDQGIGDLFVIRVAGNVCGANEIASIEYGIDHLGTPLLVVLGHRDCGAVTAAATGAEVHGNIPALLDNISPAVAAARKKHPSLRGKALVAEAVKENVWQGIRHLFGGSSAARRLAASDKLRVLGAVYDIESGEVEWLGPLADQDELLRLLDAGAKASPSHGAHETPAEPQPEPQREPQTESPNGAPHESLRRLRQLPVTEGNPGYGVTK